MVKIEFERLLESHGILFRDAIYLPDDHSMSEGEIESIKEQRFQVWSEAVLNPPDPPEEKAPGSSDSTLGPDSPPPLPLVEGPQ